MQSMAKAFTLDTTDWKILRELQGNGRISNVDLAERIGLSPPPTLRRVQALEKAGVIKGYRAQLNAAELGYGVQLIAMVGLKSQGEGELQEFERRVKGWPIVRECYTVAGGADFILKCVARDLDAVQSFVMGALSAAPNVDSVKTSLILRVAKDEPGVPLL
jgi:DNA-binding Lrp family transcriptional regulator